MIDLVLDWARHQKKAHSSGPATALLACFVFACRPAGTPELLAPAVISPRSDAGVVRLDEDGALDPRPFGPVYLRQGPGVVVTCHGIGGPLEGAWQGTGVSCFVCAGSVYI